MNVLGTRAAMLDACRNLIGTGERSDGGNFITDWYGEGPGAWCDMAVSYAANKSGCDSFIGKFAFVPYHAEYFQQQSRFVYGTGSTHNIEPGDIVFFHWGGRRTTDADHVGICESNDGSGVIVTLEGNTGDAYKRKYRSGMYIAGYATPPYKLSATNPGVTNMNMRTLRVSDQGLQVKILQVLLNDVWRGSDQVLIAADGVYGLATEKRVKEEQGTHGLVSDGVCGEKTWALLLGTTGGK